MTRKFQTGHMAVLAGILWPRNFNEWPKNWWKIEILIFSGMKVKKQARVLNSAKNSTANGQRIPDKWPESQSSSQLSQVSRNSLAKKLQLVFSGLEISARWSKNFKEMGLRS